MYRLLRFYSVASAVAILAATVVLVVFYRQNAVNELIETAESQNIALARSFTNVVWPKFSSYVTSVSGADGETLRARPETRQIQAVLAMLTAGLPVLKVKIYSLEGLTVFSSEPSQMGADKSKNLGFLASAREGKPASKLSFRDTFSAFSGVVENRDLVESYIPIRGDDGVIEGVFELYTDVTPLMNRIDRVTIELVAGLLFVFGLLYGALSLIVRRADRILKGQYTDLLKSKETIEAQNVALEHENTERRAAEEALLVAQNTLEERVHERTIALEGEIAERRRVEEETRVAKDQAVFANRSKSEFLANMSHELRTPLNAILGFSEMILRETFGPVGSSKYLDYATDINDSGSHLLELINDILDLSKIEAGKIELFEENVDVSRMLQSCVNLVKVRATEGGVEIVHDSGANVPLLYADERKLKQIMLNLLSNAVKFTPAGGKITIKTWFHPENGHVFQVADTGIGIAPENILYILTPFNQGDGGLSRKYEGTGLGLPLSKALVELHGGSLDLQSEVGVGTTVALRFPVARAVSGSSTPAAQQT